MKTEKRTTSPDLGGNSDFPHAHPQPLADQSARYPRFLSAMLSKWNNNIGPEGNS